MSQRTFKAASILPQGQAGWTLAKVLAPLLRPWLEPRPLYPDQLSDHWRRDLGLPERDGHDPWARLERW